MLNAEDKPERKQSSSDSELEREFGARLRQAIGSRSVLSFAKECGISDSLVRKYLAGSLPGLDKALTMARVAGVSLEWLATGRGSPEQAADSAAKSGLGPADIDLDLLERVATVTLEELQARRIHLEPAAQGRLLRVLYRHFASRREQPDHDTVSNIIDLAAYR
ncbi:helix-turn-helix domain-containing protein [Halomonas sp. E14]|uniref:helix-turn-helix domain-containing protein n=1 Tax=Halomonas sp. E14 TaxID=3397245 RepID=UPI00403EC519